MYSLLNVRSPAPPLVALVGLFSILVVSSCLLSAELLVGSASRLRGAKEDAPPTCSGCCRDDAVMQMRQNRKGTGHECSGPHPAPRSDTTLARSSPPRDFRLTLACLDEVGKQEEQLLSRCTGVTAT